MIPVVLDVDTGVDDALALAWALSSKDLTLLAVTTVAGNVEVEQATWNTRQVLDYFGVVTIPVARGAARPLLRPHRDARDFHGPNGLGGAELRVARRGPILDVTTPELLVRLVRRYAGELVLVCLAPLTNLAMALRLEPSLPDLVHQLVIMGGAFSVPGNVSPYAEFNVWSDPEAATIVADAGFRAVWIGLDVTMQVRLDFSTWEALEGSEYSFRRLAREILHWNFAVRGNETVALHEPLACVVAAHPDVVQKRAGLVEVISWPEVRAGQTVFREKRDGSSYIATEADRAHFWRIFGPSLERTAP